MSFNWTKHGRVEKETRRIAIPVSTEMEKLLEVFRSAYPDVKFSDAKIIGTFVEAGARSWVTDFYVKKNQNQTPVPQDEDDE